MASAAVIRLLTAFLIPAFAAATWEWAATFDLPAGQYTWSFTKQDAGYADLAIQILVLKTDGTSDSALDAVKSAVDTAWASPVVKSSYQTLDVGSSYNLQLDEQTWTTHFILDVDVGGGHAVFLQHFPYEFENGFHFLQTEGGEDVEPIHEEGNAAETSAPAPKPAYCPWSQDWEWSGIFPVSAGWHDWNAEKAAEGAYADATMKIAIFDASAANFSSALLTQAQTSWAATNSADELEAGGTIPLNRAITLKFSQITWASHFKIQVPSSTSGYIAVFAQHFPIEFEKNYHYLKDASGADVEPEIEQSGNDCVEAAPAEDGSGRMGEVILASFLTVLPTLLGLICITASFAPALVKMTEDNHRPVAAVNCFASGVIFAAAVFLLLPEGLYLVSVGKTEAAGAGAWGSAVILGWLCGVVCKHCGQIYENSKGMAREEAGQASQIEQGEEDPKGAIKRIDWTVAVPVLYGDAFHNLADGLVLGTAFRTCTASFAWKLTLVTILHEAPQEVSDFAVLVTRGRMHWSKAAVFNFLSGLSTVLGAIITYSANVSVGVEGFILAAGGGAYMYVAMTELGPSVTDLFKGEKFTGSLMRLFTFAVGATILGLILLDHEHCGGEHLLDSEGGAHAAHGH